MPTVFIDTNIFLYAMGADSEHREPSAEILRWIAEGSLRANTNAEVVQEVMHVLARRGAPESAARAANGIAQLFPSMLPVTRVEVVRAAELLGRFPGLPPRDLIHVATMLQGGLRYILSADKDFDAIADVERISPLDASALARVRER